MAGSDVDPLYCSTFTEQEPLMSRLKNFRQTETLAELGRLRAELSSWLKRKKGADARGQYTTQLAVLERELCDAVASY